MVFYGFLPYIYVVSLNKLNWKPWNERRLFEIFMFMRKIFKNEVSA